MSARHVTPSSPLHSHHSHVMVEARQTRLTLPPDAVVLSRHGIEFRSRVPFSEWKEMTLTLHSPLDDGRIHCNGVVISCTGNKHTGYHVSMVFTGLSKQAQARLSTLAFSHAF